MEQKSVVISLGGSIIAPDDIDVPFVRDFAQMIRDYVGKGYRFVIITGGGKVCRRYQDALKQLRPTTIETLDWMGIYTTRMNGQFIRLVLEDIAHDDVVLDPTVALTTDKPVIIGAGWKPGWSTDYDAVTIAERVGAKTVINLSNIDYAYDSDPRTNPNAKKLESVTWKEFRSLFPEVWEPGANVPFDPIASKKAEELGLNVLIMNGRNLENLKNYIEGSAFLGTHIHG